MKALIKHGMEKLKSFSVLDVTVWKVSIFTLGLVLGTFFASALLPFIWYLIVLFIISYAYVVYIVFMKK